MEKDTTIDSAVLNGAWNKIVDLVDLFSANATFLSVYLTSSHLLSYKEFRKGKSRRGAQRVGIFELFLSFPNSQKHNCNQSNHVL